MLQVVPCARPASSAWPTGQTTWTCPGWLGRSSPGPGRSAHIRRSGSGPGWTYQPVEELCPMSSSTTVRLAGVALLVGAAIAFVTALYSALVFVGSDPTQH